MINQTSTVTRLTKTVQDRQLDNAIRDIAAILANINSSGPSDALQLNDVTGAEPAYQEGKIFYADGTFNAYIDEPDVTLQIGQEFWVKVRNNTGSDIVDGKVVYISGAIGQVPTIALADASSVTTAFTLGVTTHNIENNSIGYVTTNGRVNGVDMSAFSDGDEVYLSATTPGELTNVKPVSPDADVTVGTVLNATPTGALLVSITEPISINDITEVNVVAPSDGDTLMYNTTNSRWENVVTNNISSTQWEKPPITPTALANGQVANGFTFFDNATDKVANGTTSYDEYNIAFGIDLILTGTSGTANINVDGTDYLATFNGTLAQTAQDWIALHGATLKALSVNVLYNGGSPLNANGDETIRFCASEASCNSVTITTVTGDLNGTRINPFTGVNAAAGDHVLIPYIGKPYEGLRIHHNFRVNFSIAVGTQQSYALSLRRFADDTIIGSEQLILRTPDEGSQLFNFITYTSGATDPFVEGGFYFALRNDSGQSCDIEGAIGILLQQTFQKSIDFS